MSLRLHSQASVLCWAEVNIQVGIGETGVKQGEWELGRTARWKQNCGSYQHSYLGELSVVQRSNPFSRSSRGKYHSRMPGSSIFNMKSICFSYVVVVRRLAHGG